MVAVEAIPCRDELSVLEAALHKPYVPCLVQRAVSRTLEYDATTAILLESGLDIGQRVCLGRVWLDPDAFERAVRVQPAEEVKGADEVVNHLHAWGVGLAVARRCERIYARAVLVIFMRPEMFVGAAVRH